MLYMDEYEEVLGRSLSNIDHGKCLYFLLVFMSALCLLEYGVMFEYVVVLECVMYLSTPPSISVNDVNITQ